MKISPKSILIVLAIIIVILAADAVYGQVRMNALSSRADLLANNIEILNGNLASTTHSLQTLIDQNRVLLANQITATQQNVSTALNQLGSFQNQVGSITGTVTTLQKLAETDPELLKKYSKVYFLNENYVPAHLSEIPNTYRYSNSKALLLQSDVLPRLEEMEDAASSTGIQLYAFSAYRSFAEQKALKSDYSMTYGAGTANSFSADQGYSEHQLGTAVDFISSGQGGVLDGFDATAAYLWMQNNAYRFGFILSYPKNNGYYIYEPWHWRFVGVKLATDLHNQNQNFYNLDQRVIDNYLTTVFDDSILPGYPK